MKDRQCRNVSMKEEVEYKESPNCSSKDLKKYTINLK